MRFVPRWRRCWAGPMAIGLAAASALAGGCERQLPARFPHNAHLEPQTCGEPGQLECPTCLSCHAGIRESEQRATDSGSECANCHTKMTPAIQEVSARIRSIGADRSIIFSHAVHSALPEIGGQCIACHPGVGQDGAEGNVYPSKPDCLTCHDAEFNNGDCGMCHRRTDMAQRVPRGFLRHDLDFVRDHGLAAKQRAKVCSQCHDQSYCTNCHDTSQTIPIEVRRPEALDRSFVHRADYVSRHSIEARSQPARCLRCHEVATCDSCHVNRGVSAARVGSTNPHPRGWVGRDPSAPTFHGRAARRDIVSCAVCHDQGPATNCIRCHKVGGHGGKPHPSGWQSARSSSRAMCRYCHGS